MGRWREAMSAYPALAAFDGTTLRIRTAAALGTQSLARHAGWRGATGVEAVPGPGSGREVGGGAVGGGEGRLGCPGRAVGQARSQPKRGPFPSNRRVLQGTGLPWPVNERSTASWVSVWGAGKEECWWRTTRAPWLQPWQGCSNEWCRRGHRVLPSPVRAACRLIRSGGTHSFPRFLAGPACVHPES